MVEGARLESEYTPKAYRGFESLPLRHTVPALVSMFRAPRQLRGVGGLLGPKPWIVEAALARLGDRQFSTAGQREVWNAPRMPDTVSWPKWWTERG